MSEEQNKAIRRAHAKRRIDAAVEQYGRQFVKREIAAAQARQRRQTKESRENALAVLRYQLADARTIARRRKLEARIGRIMAELGA